MSQAWELARQSVVKAQKHQKAFYGKRAWETNFAVGGRVLLLKLAETTRANREFAQPFHGPYRIIGMETNNLYIYHVDWIKMNQSLLLFQHLRDAPMKSLMSSAKWRRKI